MAENITPIDLLGELPREFQKALKDYVIFGVEPRGFVRAVLINDLYGAMEIGTQFEIANLPRLVDAIRNHAPVTAWGSEAKLIRFIDLHPNNRRLA